MATPTSYTVEYPDPNDFCKSGPCGTGECLGVLYYNTRPQNFCEDVTLQKDLYVIPPQIYVGGLRFVPTTIVGYNGSFTVLAAG